MITRSKGSSTPKVDQTTCLLKTASTNPSAWNIEMPSSQVRKLDQYIDIVLKPAMNLTNSIPTASWTWMFFLLSGLGSKSWYVGTYWSLAIFKIVQPTSWFGTQCRARWKTPRKPCAPNLMPILQLRCTKITKKRVSTAAATYDATIAVKPHTPRKQKPSTKLPYLE